MPVVRVYSSFAEGEELFAMLKKYAKHSDETFAFWDDFAFTINPDIEADACLVFNSPGETLNLKCYPEWVVAFMMEPGIKGENPWMFKNLDQYTRVYSPIKASDNTVLSHGFLGWYFNHNWEYLNGLNEEAKKYPISCIASNLTKMRGHRIRERFVNTLRSVMPDIHFYGKGIKYLPEKFDGIHPYYYSVAIENNSKDYYFTEKINDCFLAYTVPFYYGCKNIHKFFPEKSYIWIDINDPEAAIRTIKEELSSGNWHSRLDAVKEARELVLNKYQPVAAAASIFREIPVSNEKKSITLKNSSDLIGRLMYSLSSKLKINLH